MTCVESNSTVHKRQLFNRPTPGTKCIKATIEQYLDNTAIKSPVVLWLDYTEASSVQMQIERYATTIAKVPIGSVIRITLNANPTALGDPPKTWVGVGGAQDPVHEWRLTELKRRLGKLTPANLLTSDMTRKKLGPALLRAIEIAVSNDAMGWSDRKAEWAFSTHYADGQAMVTATSVVCKKSDRSVRKLIDGWSYATKIDAPHILDLPVLSTRERLTMESSRKTRRRIAATLGVSDLGANPLTTFETFYRMFPHFTKVDI